MQQTAVFWELAGFLFTGALGVLLHFLYEWSGGNTLAAAFSAVNESTWEHMKLLFFPMFVFRYFRCVSWDETTRTFWRLGRQAS